MKLYVKSISRLYSGTVPAFDLSVRDRLVCFSSFLVKCSYADGIIIMGVWVRTEQRAEWCLVFFCVFFFFFLRNNKGCEKQTEECIMGSVVSCRLYLWKTAGMNAWQTSGAGARQANWNSGRLTGGLVSVDMKYKKTNFVLSCVSAAPWLAGCLLGVCECVCVCVCVCVYVCTRGHEFVTHHLSCRLDTFFSGTFCSSHRARVELTVFCINLWKMWT